MRIANGIRHQHHERGGALVASLLVVTMVASLGAGLIRIQTALTRRHVQSVDTKRALYVAEAGIAEAFAAVSVGKSGEIGRFDEPASFASGVYWVESVDDGDGRLVLTSTGLVGSGRFTISVVVQRDINPAALNGLFGTKNVEVDVGSIVDGFDSRQGDFTSQLETGETHTGGGSRVTSNGDIVVEGDLLPMVGGEPDTAVYGDARPGPEGLLSVDPGALVSGATSPLSKKVDLPPVSVPVIDTSLGDLSTGAAQTLTGDQVEYDTITVSTGGELNLVGPLTLVADKLEVKSGATLRFDSTAGVIKVYIRDALRVRTGSTIDNVNNEATSVGVFLGRLGINEDEVDELKKAGKLAEDFGEEETVVVGLTPPPSEPSLIFDPTGTFYGLIYAPFSDIGIPNTLRVFGAVAARRISLAEDTRFTYDQALAHAGVGIGTLPHLLSWRIVDLPDVPLVKLRIDPVAAMTMLGYMSLPSSVAHKEYNVKLQYVDTGDVLQNYTGDVSFVVWANVKSVVSVEWQDPGTLLYSPPKTPPGSLTGGGYVADDPDALFLN